MITLLICCITLICMTATLLFKRRRFERARQSIRFRIHVNGIRGKSTVTRYVSAILRDSGIRTFGKTTGTAARVILPNGTDMVIARRGAPNINEQVDMMRSFAERRAEAAVVECMAINPDYQDWLESQVMHSHIAIITNVRLDHQEEMGESLEDIARSLARSIPRDGIVITAERQPELVRILRAVCKDRHSRLFVASPDKVRDQDVSRFGHVAHKDNIAIGLLVARLFRIPAAQAMASMVAAPADPGAFQVQSFAQNGKQVKWANLFAVNDKESFASIAGDLVQSYPDHYKIILLNNRHDRPSRVELFSKLAQDELQADAIVALGDYEDQVMRAVQPGTTKVALFGNASRYAKSSGQELIDAITNLADQKRILLIGTVNIHTRQSEQILSYIADITKTKTSAIVPTYDPYYRLGKQLHHLIDGLDERALKQEGFSLAR